MAPEKFCWNVEATKLLINQYRVHPFLYDRRQGDYSNRNKRLDVLTSIASLITKKFGVNGVCSVRDVQRKINGFRSQYLTEKHKVTNSIKSGAEGDKAYKPKAYWFPLLAFLDGSSCADESIYNLDDILIDDSTEDHDILEETHASSNSSDDDILHSNLNQDLDQSLRSDSTSLPSTSKIKFKHRCSDIQNSSKKKKLSQDTVIRRPSENMIDVSNLGTSSTEDSLEIFGKFIASELRSMLAVGNDYIVRKGKHDIQRIILDMWNEIDHYTNDIILKGEL